MKKTTIAIITIIAVLLLITSCATAGVWPKNKSCRILMLGNSFTYGNSLPTIMANIMDNLGYKDVKIDAVMYGSYNLSDYCNPEDKHYGEYEDYLAKNSYDYVIIQEQSLRPVIDYDLFRESVITLSEKAKENGAEVLLYETWGYKTGQPKLKEYGWTTEEMADMLAEAYNRLGDELGFKVMPCGMIMLDMFQKDGEMPLYLADLRHPGIGGSYLVGMTMLHFIFGIDTTRITYNPGPSTISEQQAAALRQEVMDFFHAN